VQHSSQPQQQQQQEQAQQPRRASQFVLQPLGRLRRPEQLELQPHDLLLSSYLQGGLGCCLGAGVLHNHLYNWQVGGWLYL
jgi:hypothetical protein